MIAIIMTSLLSTASGILFYPGKGIPIEEDLQTNCILPFPFSYSIECTVLIFKTSTEIELISNKKILDSKANVQLTN